MGKLTAWIRALFDFFTGSRPESEQVKSAVKGARTAARASTQAELDAMLPKERDETQAAHDDLDAAIKAARKP